MEPKITLQRATIDDIDIFITLEATAHSKMYRGISDRRTMLDKLKNNFVYLIIRDNTTVGIIRYRLTSSHNAHISGVVVHPDFQNQRIARKAFERLLEGLTNAKIIIDLVVHPHNNSAIRLYLSFGFKIESWKDNFFGDGEPRLTLILQ